MKAKNQKFLFSIFVLIVGLRNHFANCCLGEYPTEGTAEEFSLFTSDTIKKWENNAKGSSVSDSAVRDVIFWMMQAVSAHHTVTFIRGYLRHLRELEKKRGYEYLLSVSVRQKAQFIEYFTRNLTDPAVNVFYSTRVMASLEGRHEDIKKIAKEAHDEYLELTSKLESVNSQYDKITHRFTTGSLDDFEDVYPKAICKFFGNMIFGTIYDDSEIQSKIWDRGSWLLTDLKKPKETEKLFAYFIQYLDIPQTIYCPYGLEEDESLELSEQRNEYFQRTQLRIVRRSKNGLFQLTGQKYDPVLKKPSYK